MRKIDIREVGRMSDSENARMRGELRDMPNNVHYHLVGTDHKLQKADSENTGLKLKLEIILHSNQVILVAEEVNANKDVFTFGRELVGDDKWLSIDMTDQERKEAGIYDILRKEHAPEFDSASGCFLRVNAYYRKAETIRENFWINKIESWCSQRNLSEGAIIITCGINHVDFLAAKLKNRGHAVKTDESMPYDYEAMWGVRRVIE